MCRPVCQLDRDLEELNAFGREGEGVTRTAWSQPLLEAARWLVGRAEQLGLDAEIDAAGNVVARWGAGGGAVVVGSHIDTVPQGGRFDGALGVIAGLQALRKLRADGFQPRKPIWLVAFMDEEGPRFGTPMFGSRAFVGEDVRELASRRDEDGISLEQAMGEAGFPLVEVGAARAIDDVGCYLELHIEQGPVLEEAGIDVGVVTHIAGSTDLEVSVQGHASHAGTTPMDVRADALVGAARLVCAIRDEASRSEVRATVGKLFVSPGASNVIPGAARFSVDVRATEDAAIDGFAARVRQLTTAVAAEEGLQGSVAQTAQLASLALSPELQRVLLDAAAAAGASAMKMPSGAAHDAIVLGRHVPAAMLFVPSRAGVSHNPAELTSPEQCSKGAEVLSRAVAAVAA